MADDCMRVDRPHFPTDYGTPTDRAGLLPWQHVRDRMSAARTYWISTVDDQNRPHATPVWGVWLDDAFYFDGSPETRRGRNIAGNAAIAVHLESGDDVLILQGDAHELRQSPLALREQLSAAYSAKYRDKNYAPPPETWAQGGLYRLDLRKVIAWTSFPADVTRWQFG